MESPNTSPDSGAELGEQIDRYQVVSVLGTGGFGTVFRARHVVLDQFVALKILHPDRARDSDMARRFLQEAKAAAAIGNPHIVRVVDAGTTEDGRYFLAMELLEGRGLDEVLAAHSQGLPFPDAFDLVKQILTGLSAAHAARIVHRDLKPPNVFVTAAGDRPFVKLLDFGISKMQDPDKNQQQTRAGMILGTPSYMAPEQFLGAEVDGRADVYSAACILYQALSGGMPFEGDTYETLLLRIHSEPPIPLASRVSGLRPGVSALVERGLSRDPDGRWQSADEMRHAMERIEAGDLSVLSDNSTKMVGRVGMPAVAKTSSGFVLPGNASMPPAGPPSTPQPMVTPGGSFSGGSPAPSTPVHAPPPYSAPSPPRFSPSHSAPSHSASSHSAPSHSAPSYSAHPPLSAATPSYSTPPHSTPPHSTHAPATPFASREPESPRDRGQLVWFLGGVVAVLAVLFLGAAVAAVLIWSSDEPAPIAQGPAPIPVRTAPAPTDPNPVTPTPIPPQEPAAVVTPIPEAPPNATDGEETSTPASEARDRPSRQAAVRTPVNPPEVQAPSPAPAPTPPPEPTGRGIRMVVSPLGNNIPRDAARRAFLPAAGRMGRCRQSTPQEASVQVLVTATGRIMASDPYPSHSATPASQCAADVIRSLGSVNTSNGIVRIRVTLPAR
ncbi:MAG: protein kinase [Myxococcota bacterium]